MWQNSGDFTGRRDLDGLLVTEFGIESQRGEGKFGSGGGSGSSRRGEEEGRGRGIGERIVGNGESEEQCRRGVRGWSMGRKKVRGCGSSVGQWRRRSKGGGSGGSMAAALGRWRRLQQQWQR